MLPKLRALPRFLVLLRLLAFIVNLYRFFYRVEVRLAVVYSKPLLPGDH